MDYIGKKYKNRVFLEALDKNRDREIKRVGGAPRGAVMAFLSNLSEQLFRYNVMKANVEADMKQRQGMAITYLVLFIIFAVFAAGAIIYFFIWENLMYADRKLEWIWFLIVTVIAMIYIIIVSAYTFRKNWDMYKVVFNTKVFGKESIIQHMISMFDVDSKFIKSGVSTKDIQVKGSNPLVGYFVYINRKVPVRYDYKASPMQTAQFSNGDCGKVTRFTFNDKNKKTYSLDATPTTGLLSRENLPCSVVGPSISFVDPFIPTGSGTLVNPMTFLKKLQKYDFYGQMNRLGDAVSFFKGMLLKSFDVSNVKPLNDAEKETLIADVANILSLDFIIVRGFSPYGNAMVTLKKTAVAFNPLDLITKGVLDDTCQIACYIENTTQKIGYTFTETELANFTFNFENNNASNSFILVKKSAKAFWISAESNPPMDAMGVMYNQGGQINSIADVESGSVCELIVDKSSGLVKGVEDNFVYRPSQASPYGPSYTSLFRPNTMTASFTNDSPPDLVFAYKFNGTNFWKQNQTEFINFTMIQSKPILTQKSVDMILAKDPATSMTFTTYVTDKIVSLVRMYYGSVYQQVSGIIGDLMVDIPNEITRQSASLKMNASMAASVSSSDPMAKYITYDRFLSKIKDMTQGDFTDKFMANLEEIRHTSGGLYDMYQTYNLKNSKRYNDLIKELSFRFLIVIGAVEIVRFIVNKRIDYVDTVEFLDLTANEEVARLEAQYANSPDLRDQAVHKLMSEKDVSRRKLIMDSLMHISIAIMIYLTLVGILYAWKEKSKGVFEFNTIVLERNGDVIAMNARQLLDYFVDQITRSQSFVRSGVLIDTGDVDEMFESLKKSMIVDSSSPVLMPSDVDLKEQYDQLIRLLESFDKCNALMSIDVEMPFPVLEITLYVVMMIIVIVLITVIITKLEPMKKLENIRKWVKLSKLMSQDIRIRTDSFGFECPEDAVSKAETENAVTLLMAVLITLISILFVVTLVGNANSFKTSLYASDLFKDSKCYEI